MATALKCPVCEQTQGFLEVLKYQRWTIWACDRCGLKFADPLEYGEGAFQEIYGNSADHQALERASQRRFLQKARRWARFRVGSKIAIGWLEKHPGNRSTVLDIGCGEGFFLALLKEAGFVPVGQEIAEGPVRMLGKRGFPVHLGSIAQYPPDWPQPAALTLFEVIEHLPEPVKFLAAIRQRFPSVPLILSTPSPRAWWRGFHPFRYDDLPPQHILRWNETSLRLALQRAGYANIEVLFPPVNTDDIHAWIVIFFIRLMRVSKSPQNAAAQTPELSEVRATNALRTRFYWPIDYVVYELLRYGTMPVCWPLSRYYRRKGFSHSNMVAIAQ